MNRAQRLVLVVALGASVLPLGSWLTSIGSLGAIGWVAYAPLTGAALPHLGGLPEWGRMLIWLGLIAAWAGTGLFLLRATSEEGATTAMGLRPERERHKKS